MLGVVARIRQGMQSFAARGRVEPVKVAFLVSSLASWKVEETARIMHEDMRFDVTIYLCPLVRGKMSEVRDAEIEKLRRHFADLTFRVCDLSKLDESTAAARFDSDRNEVHFFTNPHKLTWRALHERLFLKGLSVYVPYSYEVAEYAGNYAQYDQKFHNAMWRIFVPHQTSVDLYRQFRTIGDRNVFVTGYSCCEPLWSERGASKAPNTSLKTIVWAPHWILNEDLQWATVYELGTDMMAIAEEFKDRIQWVVRPHPLLRQHLAAHADWGPEKTDAFYAFWETAPFARVEIGDYVPTFLLSHAMIHDSGSFLAEYLFLDRPVMYLRTAATSGEGLNTFGQKARDACSIGGSRAEIRHFLEDIVAGRDSMSERRAEFISCELEPTMTPAPSRQIADHIVTAIRQ